MKKRMFALILIGILIISTIAVLAARPDWVTDKLADKVKGPKNKDKAVKEKHNPVVEHGKEQCIVQREINGKMKTTNICISELKHEKTLQLNSGHGRSQQIRRVIPYIAPEPPVVWGGPHGGDGQ